MRKTRKFELAEFDNKYFEVSEPLLKFIGYIK